MFKLRVDTGGTFTDCWGLADDDQAARQVKVLSSGRLRVSVREWISATELTIETPETWHIGEGFFDGFQLESAGQSTTVESHSRDSNRLLLAEEVSVSPSIDLFTGEEAPILGARLLTGTGLNDTFPPLEFRLATTRGTNALLEHKGAPVAFFVTEGFGDLLHIRDQRRPDLFALEHKRPRPLAEGVVEVEGRLDAEGNEIQPLVLDTYFEEECRNLVSSGITMAAVALLHSYRNPAHEEELRKRLFIMGFSHVSLSSELAPLIKILPRAETSVANAYLHPVMQTFLDHIRERAGEDTRLLTMTSAGGLEPANTYCPKDSLLSGPAGGVSGAAAIAEELGYPDILTFDMGGTSTDVARYAGGFQYRFEQIVGDARLLSPALKIETVASGGGSICSWENGSLHVGPESAGADPGPACYGMGGPLTITDVNLLLGRIDPDNFGIPLTEENIEAARKAALDLQTDAGIVADDLDMAFLGGLLDIAVEQMADAMRTISIRDGADPGDYALLAFGGAGPLHACDIAERLGMDTILIPAEAGLLSAYGLEKASVERFSERQVNLPTTDADLPRIFSEVEAEAMQRLGETGFEGCVVRRIAELRVTGQDFTLTVDVGDHASLDASFKEDYYATFGYSPPADRAIEAVSYRAVAGTGRDVERSFHHDHPDEQARRELPEDTRFLDRAELHEGESVSGPLVIQDPFSTLFLKPGWSSHLSFNGTLIVRRDKDASVTRVDRPEQVVRELFRHRFDNLVTEMGTMLQRSAISTNVKERADYSCALLDGEGRLISSAPHIPVHLGALGLCVRMVREQIEMDPGDTIVTNHPAVGGSHLPDVTLITPVFSRKEKMPVGYIANRAHHAEIGGVSPGSMPPNANNLAEEGVVIWPMHLIRGGESNFDAVSDLLTGATYPTRRLSDNLADLNAQLAANRRGQTLLEGLIKTHGAATVREQMNHVRAQSLDALTTHLEKSGFTNAEATERLDDHTEITVSIENKDGVLHVDFTGTAAKHPGNLNATPAIVQSALLYSLRLWIQQAVPLNEGLLDSVEIQLPTCFLNPAFDPDPGKSPAVVGGNVETSQRLVDTLLRALAVQACSQGTMNNFLFGDDTFGYYETICGGSGAGEGYDGTSGIHTHMTNTAITDPEILEQRYPVRLKRFSLRWGSGGAGKWKGGDGVVREVEFLKKLEVSLLTQHRKEAPYGMAGGEDGKCGQQWLSGKTVAGIAAFSVKKGDRLVIETPGGGGYG